MNPEGYSPEIVVAGPESIRLFEVRMQERERQIAGLLECFEQVVSACHADTDASTKATDRIEGDQSWQVAREKIRKAAKAVNEAVNAYFDELNDKASCLTVPEGIYESEVFYPARCHGQASPTTESRQRTFRLGALKNLRDLLRELRSELDGYGIHNRGLQVGSASRIAIVNYSLRGPGDFTYNGQCWVDDGGGVRTKDPVKVR